MWLDTRTFCCVARQSDILRRKHEFESTKHVRNTSGVVEININGFHRVKRGLTACAEDSEQATQPCSPIIVVYLSIYHTWALAYLKRENWPLCAVAQVDLSLDYMHIASDPFPRDVIQILTSSQNTGRLFRGMSSAYYEY